MAALEERGRRPFAPRPFFLAVVSALPFLVRFVRNQKALEGVFGIGTNKIEPKSARQVVSNLQRVGHSSCCTNLRRGGRPGLPGWI